MATSFYNTHELVKMGFMSIGENVLISRKCSIYFPEKIIIGNNVRIDDFALLSGKVTMDDYIHIAAFTSMYGGNEGIDIHSYSTLSSRCAVYAVSDDYSGEAMTNPMIPDEYRNIVEKKVTIGRHVIVGTGTTVLPGTIISEGVAFGCMSMAKGIYDEWNIYAGVPARKIKERSRRALYLEGKMLAEGHIC